MLTVTDAAWERLTEIVSSRPNITALRLTHNNGRVKCRSGNRKETDRSVEHDGRPLLLMTPRVAKRLSGRTLDAPTTERGPRLRLKQLPIKS